MRLNSNCVLILVVVFFVALSFACSNSGGSSEGQQVEAASVDPENAEVSAAMALIDQMPDSPAGYRALAQAHILLGRRTGDPEHNRKALEAVEAGLAKSVNDIVLRKLKATVLLSDHRFDEALQIGLDLQKELPKDPNVMGILADAHAQLGNYPEALRSAQEMVDMRPDSASYARAAYMRSLYGEHEGAVELYRLAARTADPADTEAQAWCLSQLGNELWSNGKYSNARAVFDEALAIFPDYHHALYGKGRTLASEGKLDEAAAILEKARSRVAALDTVLLLGDVYAKAGDTERSKALYQLAEGGESTLGPHYDEHRMALFWADQGVNLDRAVEIAEADYASIKDIYASDILAWCYFKSGRLPEAKKAINEAMRLKTRDARIYFHAGMIEKGLGNSSAARTHLETALKINPQFDLVKADLARTALNELN